MFFSISPGIVISAFFNKLSGGKAFEKTFTSYNTKGQMNHFLGGLSAPYKMIALI